MKILQKVQVVELVFMINIFMSYFLLTDQYVLIVSLAGNIDINTFMFMQGLDFETKKLKNLGIRPYQVS